MEAQQNNETSNKPLSALDALILLRKKFINCFREFTKDQDTTSLENYLQYYESLTPEQLVGIIVQNAKLADVEMSIRFLTILYSIRLTDEQVDRLSNIIKRMISICTK